MTYTNLVLGVVGLVHLVPAGGVVGSRVSALYGIAPEGEVAVLLRHRAVLFGLLAAACFGAALRREWQPPVLVGALISTTSFVVLGVSAPGLRVVWWADLAMAVLLASALLARRSV